MVFRPLQYLQKEALGHILPRELSRDVGNLQRFHSTRTRDLHSAGPGGNQCRFRLLASYLKTVKHQYRELSDKVNNKVNVLAILFAKQCNAVVAQRARRTIQISLLYHKLGYDKQALKNVVESFGRGFFKRKSPLFALVGAAAFQWENNSISDEQLKEVADEIVHLQRPTKGRESCPTKVDEHYMDAWETVINRDHFKLWRRPIPDTYLYEYKVFGTYNDLPAQAFYNAQLDTEFRKQWDKLVVKLDVIDSHEESNQEVVQWVMHFPFPLYSREYVYIRKTLADERKRMYVIAAQSVDHPMCPRQSKYVRVDTYVSHMVIRAHGQVEENGFDYILTYYDEPKAPIPTAAYNWMASTGVPDFVDKVHNATKILHDKKMGIRPDDSPTGSQGTSVAM